MLQENIMAQLCLPQSSCFFWGCWQACFPAIFVQQLSLAGAVMFGIPENEDRNKMQNTKSSDKSFICSNNVIYFEICGHDLI
jgi:hypothetical protein